jgi:hypothetical protein
MRMHDPFGKPQAPTLGLSGGDLQTFTPPQALDAFVVDLPSRPAQELSDLAIAVPAILPGQRDHVGRQPFLVFRPPRHLALCRAMLAERRTRATLRHRQHRPDMVDHGSPARGA